MFRVGQGRSLTDMGMNRPCISGPMLTLSQAIRHALRACRSQRDRTRTTRLRIEPLELRVLPTAVGMADSGLCDSWFSDEEQVTPSHSATVTRARRKLLHAGQKQLLDQAITRQEEAASRLQTSMHQRAGVRKQYDKTREILDGLEKQLPPETGHRQQLVEQLRWLGNQITATNSTVTELEDQIAHIETNNIIELWTQRHGPQSSEVHELKASLAKQQSQLWTVRGQLAEMQVEQDQLQAELSSLPKPSEALTAAVAHARTAASGLRQAIKKHQESAAECRRQMQQAHVRLQDATRLAVRQASSNVRRICLDHLEALKQLSESAAKFIATADQNTHVRLNIGSFDDWRSHHSRFPPLSNHIDPAPQHRLGTELSQAIDLHVLAELSAIPRNRDGRFAVDMQADLGTHFIVEAANSLLGAREAFATRHDQLRQAIRLATEAELPV